MGTNISLRVTIAGLCMYVPDERNAGRPVMHVVMPATNDSGGTAHPSAHKHEARLMVDGAYQQLSARPGTADLRAEDISQGILDLSELAPGEPLPVLPPEIRDIAQFENDPSLKLQRAVVDTMPTERVAGIVRLAGGTFTPGPIRYVKVRQLGPEWVTGMLDWRINLVSSSGKVRIPLKDPQGNVFKEFFFTPCQDQVWLCIVHLPQEHLPKRRENFLYLEDTNDDHFESYLRLWSQSTGGSSAAGGAHAHHATVAQVRPRIPYVICVSPKATLA